MIVVCDINEIWRRKPFVALAELTDVLGVAPMDWLRARSRNVLEPEGRLEVLSVTLPPSWASRTAWLGQRLLWRQIQNKAKSMGKKIDGLVVTSPHYLPLLNIVPADLKTVYYASDDYYSYQGWGSVVLKEKKMVQHVDHSVFVSDALMERVRQKYGIDKARLSVSMNASEPRFFPDTSAVASDLPCRDLPRPVAGVVGGIGDRLDLDLLRRCAEVDALGTLLLVGPLPDAPSAEMRALLAQPKCVAVGAQPHDEIHRWFQCLDVALIPYARTEFNRFCSPMRLFDHLASGLPIIALDSCDQVARFSPDYLCSCHDQASFLASLNDFCTGKVPPYQKINPDEHLWSARADSLIRHFSVGMQS